MHTLLRILPSRGVKYGLFALRGLQKPVQYCHRFTHTHVPMANGQDAEHLLRNAECPQHPLQSMRVRGCTALHRQSAAPCGTEPSDRQRWWGHFVLLFYFFFFVLLVFLVLIYSVPGICEKVCAVGKEKLIAASYVLLNLKITLLKVELSDYSKQSRFRALQGSLLIVTCSNSQSLLK